MLWIRSLPLSLLPTHNAAYLKPLFIGTLYLPLDEPASLQSVICVLRVVASCLLGGFAICPHSFWGLAFHLSRPQAVFWVLDLF